MASLLVLLIFLGVFWIGPAAGAAAIAGQKGRSGAGFFVFGLFFGLIALIVAAVISPLPGTGGASVRAVPLMQCPTCAGATPSGSKMCRVCGEAVPEHLVPKFGPGRCQECGAEQPRPAPRLCKMCGRSPAGV